MKKRKWQVRPERKSTTDRYGNSTEKVEEDVIVVPPSHLLREQGCALTGGAFLKTINKFLDDYYNGNVVLGRSREMKPINWDVELCDRSPYQFFMEYPLIIDIKTRRVFKIKMVVKI